MWTQRMEGGTPSTIALLFVIARHTRWLSRILMRLICVGYMFCARRTTVAASWDYLPRVLDKPPTWLNVYQHHLVFAMSTLDRTCFLTDKTDGFHVETENDHVVKNLIAKKQGFMLYGSHMGSFDCAKVFSQDINSDFKVKYLMYENHMPAFQKGFRSLNPKLTENIIDLNNPDSMLDVADTIGKGNAVAILGDRFTGGDKCITCDFLGKPASFPYSPIILASVLRTPLVLFFGVYLGNKRYHIVFETLCDSVTLRRAHREEDARHYVERYVKRLEYYTRKYPYNWFNFYHFWQ